VYVACMGGNLNAYSVGRINHRAVYVGFMADKVALGQVLFPSSCANYVGKTLNQPPELIDSQSILCCCINCRGHTTSNSILTS
jgi:hypothetical protein